MNKYLIALLEEAYDTALYNKQYIIAMRISELFNDAYLIKRRHQAVQKSDALHDDDVYK